jgi:hypothetical protein
VILLVFVPFLLILVGVLNPIIPRDWGGDSLCRLGLHGGPFSRVDKGWVCARCGKVLPPGDFIEDHR